MASGKTATWLQWLGGGSVFAAVAMVFGLINDTASLPETLCQKTPLQALCPMVGWQDSCPQAETARYSAEPHRLAMTVRPGLDGFSTIAAAKADALARGKADAERLCSGYSSGEYLLRDSEAEASRWDCASRGGRAYCGFDGLALCDTDAKIVDVAPHCRAR